ncbi:MAG: type II toxin-antitoxin system tRNA(fMet)-specific endonuclease VapC [Myxococcaceae bacterium]
MKFLLDTDTCIYVLKEREPAYERFAQQNRISIALSVFTEAELRTGALKSQHPIKNLQRIEAFLKPLVILDFTSEDAEVYAQTRAKLEKAGTLIGPMDLLIAAHALSRKLTLVTNNTREFYRVTGIHLANWSE